MKSESGGTVLTVVFVDYDNIYLSLKRKNEEAAKRFAKDAVSWLREIETGRLITPTNGSNFEVPRRVVMSRCYGNPVPRRNASDNSTDMNSFPFVRHHYLRAGFEVIDCPPLTAQLKNSADIRMVMDVRDVLNHDTRFDEFIILSGDADFTPVLHRLRAHARRTVVFANDHTAAPYTAISDGEVRESDLISLLMEGRVIAEDERKAIADTRSAPQVDLEAVRREIIAEVSASVRMASQPVPLEALADRAIRTLGHDKTAGSSWGGAGSFRELLLKGLPGDIRLSEQPPFLAFDTQRHVVREPQREIEARPELRAPRAEQRMEPVRYEVPAPRVEQPRAEAPRAPRMDARVEPQRPQYDRPNYDAPPAPRYTPREDGRVAYSEPPREELRAPMTERPEAHREVRVPMAAQRTDGYRGEPELPVYAAQQAAPRAPVYAPQAQPAAPQARPFTPPPAQAFVPSPAPYARESAPQAPQQSYAPPPQQQQPAAPTYRQSAPVQPQAPAQPQSPAQSYGYDAPRGPLAPPPAQQQQPVQQHAPQQAPMRAGETASQLQQSISRIHEACQAPTLSPPEYRVLFEVMADEINANSLSGSQTLINIGGRALDMGLEVRREDIRFVLEVVSEPDPWFEQGASANLFASRFRNFVIARCRAQGLNLTSSELDLVDAWFGGAPASRAPQPQSAPQQQAPASFAQPQGYDPNLVPQRPYGEAGGDDEFPRIVRSRLRG